MIRACLPPFKVAFRRFNVPTLAGNAGVGIRQMSDVALHWECGGMCEIIENLVLCGCVMSVVAVMTPL